MKKSFLSQIFVSLKEFLEIKILNDEIRSYIKFYIKNEFIVQNHNNLNFWKKINGEKLQSSNFTKL